MPGLAPQQDTAVAPPGRLRRAASDHGVDIERADVAAQLHDVERGGVDRDVDAKALATARGQQRGEQMPVIILGDGLMDEPNAAVVEQLAVLVFGIDDDETLLVVTEMALDQRQGALADRAEADHHYGPVDAGMHWPLRHISLLQSQKRLISAAAGKRKGSRAGIPRGVHDYLSAALGGGRHGGLRDRASGGADHAAGAVERALPELEREQPVAFEWSGQTQAAGLFGGEAETAVIGRIADQDDGTMAEPLRLADRAADQSGADAAVAAPRGHGDWPEQQRWLPRGTGDLPEPRGAKHPLAFRRDEAQPCGRQPAVAQALRAFAVTRFAESLVEQRFTRSHIARPFLTHSDHLRSSPSRRAGARGTSFGPLQGEGEAGEPASRVVQMW
jgi:hypothetical protein